MLWVVLRVFKSVALVLFIALLLIHCLCLSTDDFYHLWFSMFPTVFIFSAAAFYIQHAFVFLLGDLLTFVDSIRFISLAWSFTVGRGLFVAGPTVTVGLRFGIGFAGYMNGGYGKDCRLSEERDSGDWKDGWRGATCLLLIESVCADGNMTIRDELVP